ncbi:MAG: hypothetical protein A2849_01570 [Candidatus Taylorbacteria bacterium RIFCSPHIGHO2_01_FULL_51_15]|uniref:Cell division protein FtsL n=1 Tax=Candidatus Taylorbacteria bacterium RIFCSPHIGHO2_01_FULL_51_15 TaxID=1802304 RepID=A0A1G2MDV3_9BACT|nr:MAG: hypothetical protein A2849_01570 [Candidatus Taylorbacteria bacterium RIFCSPHIGHO2_01_FULL_51_15]
MRDFQRKRKIKKALYSRGVLAVLFLLLVLIGKATFGVYVKERESKKNLIRVERELLSLQTREEKLRQEIAHLSTPEGIETQIREQFQVAKPGERMVVLVAPEKNTLESEIPKESLVTRFFNLFR